MVKKGLYTKKVMEYFKNPKNVGKIKNADGIGKVGNIVCGDVMWLYIKVGKNKKGKEIIKNIKFETFGCVAALATSSIVTELVKGKTIDEALNFSRQDVVDALGGLPPVKIHCSVLAVDALFEAIYDYLSQKKKTIPKKLVKRHQRIEEEKKLIEKKYKDWINLEEEVHKKQED